MESVLFGMFVIAIACDQFEAIFSDETLVEQAKKQVSHAIVQFRAPIISSLQGPFRPRRPRLALLSEVCGRGHPLMWLLPCHSGENISYDPLPNYDV